MAAGNLKLFLVGDLILDEPQPDSFFDCCRDTLRQADVLAGHVEVPHTVRGKESSFDVPAPASDPANLGALSRAGFHVATLAGNHIFDAGPDGIQDTVDTLQGFGIATTGAGMNLADASKPAIVERHGIRLGFLSYNCVGPRDAWAGSTKAGCAYVRVITHYELEYATPGGPPTIYTFAEPESLERMQADIERAARDVDVLVVALHKGIVHTPAMLAGYERPVAKAAIDAGAHIVAGHHAHILQGVEVYKGRPIFHGLGNFVTVTRALNADGNSSAKRQEWARRRRKLFGFDPDADYPAYPFHPEAKNAMIGVCEMNSDGVLRAGFLPCWIKPSGQPEVLGHNQRGIAVAEYVEKITRTSGLSASFGWEEDRVRFL